MIVSIRAWIVGAVLLVGCSDQPDAVVSSAGASGSTTDSSGGNAAGGTHSGGAHSGGVAGSADSGKAGNGSGGAPAEEWKTTTVSLPLSLRALLDVTQMSSDDVNFTYELYAQFGMLRGQWDGCTRHQLGECWYYECPVGSAPVGTPDVGPLRNVGNVTFTSSTMSYVVRPDQTLIYSVVETGAFWPLSGGSVTFAAAGPPQLEIAVKTPPSVWLSTLNGQAAPASIKRSEGAKLTWRVRGSGQAFFSIYRLSGTIPAAVCSFDAERAEGTLPAAVLQKLAAGTDYRIAFRGDSRATLTLEGYELDASLFAIGGSSSSASNLALE
jgi:hypothetical protein